MSQKDDAARQLAQKHFEIEPGLKRVFRIRTANEDAPNEPIKLLEINVETVSTGSVEPYLFAPSEIFPYPTVIAEITEGDFELLERHELTLPDGWNLASAEELKAS